MTSTWPATDGTVSPVALCPALPTALPRMIAWIRSPSSGSLHRLQQNEATAVAWYVAVGTFIECVGMAGRRYRAEFLFQHGCFACQVEVNTTGNRQRRFACSHAFACQMHRYQG